MQKPVDVLCSGVVSVVCVCGIVPQRVKGKVQAMKEKPKVHTCLKCGYQWEPRIERRPRVCPRCKNHDWDKPRREIK